MFIVELIVEFGPFVALLAYMWIIQQRQKAAIMCLARNSEEVDENKIRESFRLLSD